MWDPYRIPVGTGKALVRPDRGGAAPRGLGTSGQRRVAGDAVRRMPRCVTLEEELAAAIEAAGRGAPPPDFAAWALRVFAHQFEHNAPYRAFCTRRGVA